MRGQVVHRFAGGLVLEGYADWQDRPDGRDVSTLEAFAGWQAKTWRASLQYGRQERREAGPDRANLSLDFLSAFAAVKVSGKATLVGRVDRNFDPIPGGETTDYVPFSDGAKSVFGYVGVDLTLHENVHEAEDGTTPGTDVMPRLTLFFSW